MLTKIGVEREPGARLSMSKEEWPRDRSLRISGRGYSLRIVLRIFWKRNVPDRTNSKSLDERMLWYA